MFYNLEIQPNKTYWFSNTHNAIFNFNLLTKQTREKSTLSEASLCFINGEKVLTVCSMNDSNQNINLSIPINKEDKDTNYGLFIYTGNTETSDSKDHKKNRKDRNNNEKDEINNTWNLFGYYEFEETIEKFIPVRESRKVHNVSEEFTLMRSDLNSKYNNNSNNKFNKFNKRNNNDLNLKEDDDAASYDSADRVYNDNNDESVSLDNLLKQKRDTEKDSGVASIGFLKERKEKIKENSYNSKFKKNNSNYNSNNKGNYNRNSNNNNNRGNSYSNNGTSYRGNSSNNRGNSFNKYSKS